MSTDRMTVEEMIGEGDLLGVEQDGRLTTVKVPAHAVQPVDADKPILHHVLVPGDIPAATAHVNKYLTEFVDRDQVISLQRNAPSGSIAVIRARPSEVERAKAEGRW